MFSGSNVALITPFFQGQVDEDAFRALVEWHIQEGTQGIVVGGCTGEGSLLSKEERNQILTIALDTAQKRIPVIMGCSSTSTQEVVQMVKDAEGLGAAGALVITPYLVKPMPEGIFQHFQAITEASTLPLIIYNHPGRTGIDLSVPLLARIAALPSVVGVKDSGTDLRRPIQLRQAISKPLCFLSGEDTISGAYLANGGDGCISATGNIAPKLCREMIDAWKNHDLAKFSDLREKMYPLHEAVYLETNPSTFKYAVSLLGKCHNEVRLPLVPVSENTQNVIREKMTQVGILK